MTVEQASLKLSVAGLTGLIGMATGVTIPATLDALDLFNEIRDMKRRRATKDLARAAAAEIQALRSSEYAREPDASLFASALTTAAETLDRHRLTSSAFLQLQLQPERAADAVLAHARFNRLDGDDLPAIARRILACFYAKLREQKGLLEDVRAGVYGEIMGQGQTLGRLETQTERIEEKQEQALDFLRTLAEKNATIASLAAALESATRALARDAEAAPEEPALEHALGLLAEGKTGEAEAHFREVTVRKAESGRQKLAEGAGELKEAAQAARHLGALASLHNVEDALVAYRRAAELDPDDTWTWIFISRLERAAGGLQAAAEAVYRANQLAESQGTLRDIGVAKHELGALLLAKGELPDAEQAFDAYRRTAEELAAADPRNAAWQRDLSASWEKIGDVWR